MKCTLLAAMLLALLIPTGCQRRESETRAAAEPALRTFTVQGFVRGIDFAGRRVTVEHEDIAGYMPSMTMPFDVKMMAEVEPFHVADAIEFKLIVTDQASWIEGVKKIDAREVQLPAKTAAAGPTANVARLKEGDALPEFQLVDAQGRQITRETVAGRPLLLTFIFTRCPLPNYCPLITNNFREIQAALATDAERGAGVQLLSISIDPEFDTPEVLAQYAARHTAENEQWRFAAGSPAETKRLTQAFSVAVQPEGGSISHGLATALIDAHGIIRQIWRGNGWKPAEVVEALRAL
jgi:protein SCO1/2